MSVRRLLLLLLMLIHLFWIEEVFLEVLELNTYYNSLYLYSNILSHDDVKIIVYSFLDDDGVKRRGGISCMYVYMLWDEGNYLQ